MQSVAFFMSGVMLNVVVLSVVAPRLYLFLSAVEMYDLKHVILFLFV